MAVIQKLGSLSEKYESQGRGSGTVSSGKGDAGGVSYGTYQLTSKNGGRVSEFLSKEGNEWAKEFEGLKPGSAEFSAKWKEVAAKDTDKFADAQHNYMERSHFNVLCEKLKNDSELDINQSSDTLKNVIWSTAVQHGSHNNIVFNALKGKNVSKMSEEEIIKNIYTERGKRDPKDGLLVYFKKNSKEVQESVAKRFEAEQEDALAMLKGLPLPSKQPVLKEGASGDSVRQLQEQLQRIGYNVGTDGVFGPNTKAAVEQFQKDHGLKADGIVGKNTLSTLSKADNYASLLQIQRQAYTPKSQPSFKPLEQPRLQESLQKLRK